MAYQSKLELDYTSELDSSFMLYGFKDVIFRILMELMNNALKHTEKGAVSLKVYSIGEANSVINIDVFNTGAELDQNQISRILTSEKFFDDALIKGQGFGLSMVSALAKSIDAELKVHSEKSLGTTITLVIKNEKTS
jgi:signal transduction histidine kinase